MSNAIGRLYVVATPIGNLEDMTPRAVRILSQADVIAAEDTRHSAKLLHHFGIQTEMISLHEHNESDRVIELVDLLRQGKCIALISDAGTPLVSDPGYQLVRTVRSHGIPIEPVPGACAAIAALSVAGLPTDRFVFEGFPPAKSAARRKFFEEQKKETRTQVYYESPHRILESLSDMMAAFGRDREAVIARELTKKYETSRSGRLGDLHDWAVNEPSQRRGEFVVLVHGVQPVVAKDIDPEAERVLLILLKELSVKQAAALASEITGIKKNQLYTYALKIMG